MACAWVLVQAEVHRMRSRSQRSANLVAISTTSFNRPSSRVGVQAQLDKAVVNDQIVFNRFIAWIRQVVHLRVGEGSHLLGQFAHLVALVI